MKINILTIVLLLSMSSCTYSQKITKVKIDSNIKVKSLANINTTDSPTIYSMDSIYQTTFKAKNLAEDTVIFDQLKNEFLKKDFMCNHYYDNDTLIIKGGFGLRYQMYGFKAKVYPNKEVKIELSLNWGYPSYFNSKNEELAKREILVKTVDSQLILNRLPKKQSDRKHIYGYIQFKSDDYYVEMKDKKTQIPYKERNNSEYQIYFDSRYLKDEN